MLKLTQCSYFIVCTLLKTTTFNYFAVRFCRWAFVLRASGLPELCVRAFPCALSSGHRTIIRKVLVKTAGPITCNSLLVTIHSNHAHLHLDANVVFTYYLTPLYFIFLLPCVISYSFVSL